MTMDAEEGEARNSCDEPHLGGVSKDKERWGRSWSTDPSVQRKWKEDIECCQYRFLQVANVQ